MLIKLRGSSPIRWQLQRAIAVAVREGALPEGTIEAYLGPFDWNQLMLEDPKGMYVENTERGPGRMYIEVPSAGRWARFFVEPQLPHDALSVPLTRELTQETFE